MKKGSSEMHQFELADPVDVGLVMQYLVCHILRAISMVRVCAEDWLYLVLVKLRIHTIENSADGWPSISRLSYNKNE